MKTLVLGYGNVDRQDDGLAWHVLAAIAERHGHHGLTANDELVSLPGGPDLQFVLQLTPELAETLAGYDRVCFVDAHTGAIAEDINLAPVSREFQASPFTHHMTPATCLSITDALYHRAPSAVLVSVRGYEFGFTSLLSPPAAALVPRAADQIMAWLGVMRHKKP